MIRRRDSTAAPSGPRTWWPGPAWRAQVGRAWAARVRDRLLLLRLLATMPWWTAAALLGTGFLSAVLPLGTAVATGYLVQRLAADADSAGAPVGALALVGAMALAQQAVLTLQAPTLTMARHEVDTWSWSRAAEAAMSAPGTAHLDDQSLQEDLRLATGEIFGATAGSAVVGQVALTFRYVGTLLAAGVLAVVSLPAAVVTVAGVCAMRVLVVRPALRLREDWAGHSRNARRADYWAETSADPACAMELRTFGLSGFVVDRFSRYSQRRLAPMSEILSVMLSRSWRAWALGALTIAVVMVVLADGLISGETSIGTAAAATTSLWFLFGLCRVGDEAIEIESGRAAARSADRLASRAAAWPGGASTPPAREPSVVRFEDVVFRYPNTERTVLDHLNLTVRRGEVLAVVGLNGAGKTTLTNLLTGLYEPSGGRITVDGVDLGRVPVEWWRRRLAVVFQEFIRYELPVRDNVTLGGAWHPPSPARLDRAAADVDLASLVDQLPTGWDTPLSRSRTGGMDLSGGQWQRVAIARAMYALHAGARFLVLDEPTAHLDVRTELDTFRRIVERAGDAAVVLISHRLATVRTADRIVLLAEGRVVEEGKHDTLMAADGSYAAMFRLQAERFAAPTDDVPEPA
jgi:ATP-binding cassette, subfamily B, bacterial